MQSDIETGNKWLGNGKNHFGVMCEFKSVFAAADTYDHFYFSEKMVKT